MPDSQQLLPEEGSFQLSQEGPVPTAAACIAKASPTQSPTSPLMSAVSPPTPNASHLDGLTPEEAVMSPTPFFLVALSLSPPTNDFLLPTPIPAGRKPMISTPFSLPPVAPVPLPPDAHLTLPAAPTIWHPSPPTRAPSKRPPPMPDDKPFRLRQGGLALAVARVTVALSPAVQPLPRSFVTASPLQLARPGPVGWLALPFVTATAEVPSSHMPSPATPLVTAIKPASSAQCLFPAALQIPQAVPIAWLLPLPAPDEKVLCMPPGGPLSAHVVTRVTDVPPMQLPAFMLQSPLLPDIVTLPTHIILPGASDIAASAILNAIAGACASFRGYMWRIREVFQVF
ncbi:hypothetical protein AX14_011066 [Amanita brunnescens Koide BX004]|nr:hypothetical protein AX14_011066 [Amanita brunnescens Koide BX004]